MSNLPPGVTTADINREASEESDRCNECGAWGLYRRSNLCRRCWEIARADYLIDQAKDDAAMEGRRP